MVKDNQVQRDALYRATALKCAVIRAGQDGGLDNTQIDVLAFAQIYYGWLIGLETAKPGTELEYIKGINKEWYI